MMKVTWATFDCPDVHRPATFHCLHAATFSDSRTEVCTCACATEAPNGNRTPMNRAVTRIFVRIGSLHWAKLQLASRWRDHITVTSGRNSRYSIAVGAPTVPVTLHEVGLNQRCKLVVPEARRNRSATFHWRLGMLF